MRHLVRKLPNMVYRAVQGETHDYTRGPLSEAVILLAIPMILELALESVFAIVDMFFVSRLGAHAIATVGLTEAVVSIVYSIAIGLSTAATALVSRRMGEKNPAQAAQAGAQAVILAGIFSLFLSGLGIWRAADILRLMGAHPEVVRIGTSFMQIMLGGSAPILLLFLLNGVFRGAGDAAMAMRSLWLASGVNIVLCPVLIHFWGLPGAAIATFWGRTAGVLYQVYHLRQSQSVLKMRWPDFRWDGPVMKSIATIAWPATLQFIIGSGSWIVLTKLVAETGGTHASAGYQIAFRNFMFFILPAWGLSNAAATLVGQSLGANSPTRAEHAVTLTARMSVYLMGFVTVILLFGARPIIRFYTDDPMVFGHGVEALQIIASGFVFYGYGMVLTQALNGSGDTKGPTWMNLWAFWIFQTPMAYVLVRFMGARGALVVIPCAHVLLCFMAYVSFKRGRWKTVQI